MKGLLNACLNFLLYGIEYLDYLINNPFHIFPFHSSCKGLNRTARPNQHWAHNQSDWCCALSVGAFSFFAKPLRLLYPVRHPVRLECLVAANRPCSNQTCLIRSHPVRLEFVMAPSHLQVQLRFLQAFLLRLVSHLCLVCRAHSFHLFFNLQPSDVALCSMHFSQRPGQLIAAPGNPCQ